MQKNFWPKISSCRTLWNFFWNTDGLFGTVMISSLDDHCGPILIEKLENKETAQKIKSRENLSLIEFVQTNRDNCENSTPANRRVCQINQIGLRALDRIRRIFIQTTFNFPENAWTVELNKSALTAGHFILFQMFKFLYFSAWQKILSKIFGNVD